MKVLMVNKFFYIKGGSETYYFALRRLLEDRGHTVIDFSMADEKNFPSPYSDYFVDNVDYNGKLGPIQTLRVAGKLIWSREAKKKLERLIRAERPDIAHLHLFQHQISSSVLDVLKAFGIPVVYTAHDLKMLCPNYRMLSGGCVCEACKGGKYLFCVKNKCVKDSFAKSALAAAEAYFNAWTGHYDILDHIIVPSRFYAKKFAEFGVDTGKITHIPNFLDGERPRVNLMDAAPYYLYLGRLSPEKGLHTLILAAKKTGVRLKIAGTGPLYESLLPMADENVELLGFQSGQALTDLVGNARAVILPSEWYENGPYSAIEALRLGRPLIGADIGGIPELIRDNGFLFPSGDVQALAAAIEKMEKLDRDAWQAMSRASEQLFEARHTARAHTDLLAQVYGKAGFRL